MELKESDEGGIWEGLRGGKERGKCHNYNLRA